MEHEPKQSKSIPSSSRRALHPHQAQTTPVQMRPRRLNHEQDPKLDIVDVCFTLISTVAVVAANGAVLLIIGNTLLRESSYTPTDMVSAAKIGAVGGIVAAPSITILMAIFRALPGNPIADLILGFLSDFGDIALGAMSGYFGMAILPWFAVNIGGEIDVATAAWAGVLGGIIGVWRRDFNTVFVQE